MELKDLRIEELRSMWALRKINGSQAPSAPPQVVRYTETA